MPGAALLVGSVLLSLLLGAMTAHRTPIFTARPVQVVAAPPLLANSWTDEEWGLSIAPPAWW